MHRYFETFYSFPQTADAHRVAHLPQRALQMLKESREQAHCAGCGQRISTNIEWAVRDAHTYHPSCAKRIDTRTAAAPAIATVAPTIIGTICGVALPFGEQCFVSTPSGERSERFAHDAFAASINRGGQTVQVDHDNTPIPGQLTLYTDNMLTFRLRVHDTARGRSVLEQARGGEFRGCSIRFEALRERHIYSHLISVDEANLTEVSLCRRATPAWHSTAVWIEK